MSGPYEFWKCFDSDRHEVSVDMKAPIEMVLDDRSHTIFADIKPWGKKGDYYRCLVAFEAAMLVRDIEARFVIVRWFNSKRHSKKAFEEIRTTEKRLVEKARGAMVSLTGLPEVSSELGRSWCWVSDDIMRFGFQPKDKR